MTRTLQANLKQYNVNVSGDGSSRNLTTRRNIDKVVIDSFLHVQKTLETNVSGLFSRAG